MSSCRPGRSTRSLVLLAIVPLIFTVVVLKVAAQDTKPSTGRELCEMCHDDLAAVLGGTVPHAPVEADECTACHNPHAARHGKLLNESGAALCEDCHEGIGRTAERPVPHLALGNERACLACHAPHGAEHQGLLIDEALALCEQCHASIAEQVSLEHPHAPAALGECAGCHEPHAGTSAALLEQSSPAVCWSCHESSAALRSRHRGFDISNADCLSCHGPHGSTQPALIRPAVHPPFAEDGGCEMCHESGAEPSRLVAPEGELCAMCHDGYHETVGAPKHPVEAAVRCTSCHSPHAGESPGMVRGAERVVCLDCHTKIRERLADSVSRHPPRIEGGRCTICHSPHEPTAEPLLLASRDELCVGCHQQHSRFAHPMGENVPDPRNPGQTLGCLSCHDPHASGEKMILRAAADRALCVQCHAGKHGIE